MRPADFQVLRTKFGNFSESVFFLREVGGREEGRGGWGKGEGEEGRGVGGEDWV